MGKFQDLTGQTFGRWKVLGISERKNGKIHYLCECSCEAKTQKSIQGAHLKSGASQSCGCLRKEVAAQKNKIDLTGQRFGRLVVVCEAPNPNPETDRHTHWYCNCDCGTTNYRVIGKSLRSGATQSCECVKSRGEEAIAKILQQNFLLFERDKGFDKFRYADTGFQAKFDFCVENKYLIEYDGKQHFGLGGWNDEYNFKVTQAHDLAKNQWCLENNIPLIRIPYTVKPEDIVLEMLQPETSKYLIKKE